MKKILVLSASNIVFLSVSSFRILSGCGGYPSYSPFQALAYNFIREILRLLEQELNGGKRAESVCVRMSKHI